MADVALVALVFKLPEGCAPQRSAALPADGCAPAVLVSTQDCGGAWAGRDNVLAAAIPSVLSPADHWLSHGEHHVRIHCAALPPQAMREVAHRPCAYDPRAWQ